MKKIVVLTASVFLYTAVLFGQCSVSITSQANATCFGTCNGIIMVSASGGTAPYTYLWSNGGTMQYNYGLCAGNYTVTITDALGCTSTISAIITQPMDITTTSTSTSVSCNGGSDGTANVVVTGGTPPYTYLWNDPAPAQTAATCTGLTAGTWTVTVTDANGCTQMQTVTINQPASITAFAGTDQTICSNNTVSLNGSVTVATGGHWSSSGTGTFNPDNTALNAIYTLSAADIMAGMVTLTLTTTGNGICTAATDQLTITIMPAPLATASNNGPVCEGSTLYLISSGGIAYLWTGPNGYSSTIQNPSIPGATSLMSGTYTVTVEGPSSCTATASTTVIVNPNPTPTASNTGPYCEGQTIHISSSGGTTYLWSGPNGFSSTVQNPVIPGATTSMSGTYSLTVSDNNGCTGTANTSVIINIPAFVNGTVVYSGGYIGAGDANIMLYGTGPNGHHQLVDSVLIGANGSFSLQNIQDGDYYLYVKLINNSAYQHVHNTYYDSTYKWFEAQVINLTCGNDTSVTINMFETIPPSQGSGQIDGTVNLMSSKGAKTPGEPIEGAEIYVEEEPIDEPIASTCSDANGIYEFDLIPEGIYNIYVDIPGFPLFETYLDITVTPSDTLFQGLNFYVDTTIADAGIYTEDILGSPVIITPEFTVGFYPNPVKNELSVIVLNQNEKMNIEVLNINGQSLYKSIFMEQTTIDMTEFSQGSYFVKVQSGKTVVVKKVIKQ